MMKRKIVCVLAALLWFMPLFSAEETPDTPKIRVACIGDSITRGYLIASDSAHYPEQLQLLLGDAYDVRNFGNSGRGIILSSRRGNEPRAFYKMPEHRAALAFEPDIVICNLGINDADRWVLSDTLRAEFVNDYLTLIADYEKLPSKPMIFIWDHFTPIFAPHRFADGVDSTLPAKMRVSLREVAQRANVPTLDMFTPLRGMRTLFLPDGLHPNAAGARRIAEATAQAIRPYLPSDDAKLILSPYVHDYMVISTKGARIDGLCAKNVPVSATINGRVVAAAVSDHYGRFTLTFRADETPDCTLEITAGSAHKKIEHAAVGKLYFVYGQSNAEWRVKRFEQLEKTLAQADHFAPRIRILNRSIPGNVVPCTFSGEWEMIDAHNVAEAPATGYYFARAWCENHADSTVIGIINLAVGGTTMESLVSEEHLLRSRTFDSFFDAKPWYTSPKLHAWCGRYINEALQRAHYDAAKQPLPWHALEPGRIADCERSHYQVPIDGVIYYQGESNATCDLNDQVASDTIYNQELMRLLLHDLRTFFGDSDLPIFVVQLPGLMRDWPEYRLMQARVCAQTPQTFLCCTLDLGEKNNVHPRTKVALGKRLARLAAHPETAHGPRFKQAVRSGENVVLIFDGAGQGLETADKAPPRCFELSCDGKVFVPAEAKIVAGKIHLRSELKHPAYVRYAYAPYPDINLRSAQTQLPAEPFREKIAE